jgi:hypothetical protein
MLFLEIMSKLRVSYFCGLKPKVLICTNQILIGIFFVENKLTLTNLIPFFNEKHNILFIINPVFYKL